jgi:WD40 repeat protein
LTTVAFNPGGRALAAGAADGRIHLWDGDGRSRLATLGPPAGPVRALAVSPDGRTVAAASTGVTRVWDLAAPDQPRALGDGAGRSDQLAFTADGRLLSAGQGDGILVWGPDGGRRTRIDTGGPVEAMTPLPDGRILSLDSERASLWGRDGRLESSYRLGRASRDNEAIGDARGAIAVSPNGERFAISSLAAGTEVWQLKPRALKARDPTYMGPAIAFGQDDDTLVAVDEFGEVNVHKAATYPGAPRPPHFSVPAKLSGHAGRVAALAGRADGSVATAGQDGRVILWMTRPKTITLTDPSIGQAGRVSFSGDGRRLAVADNDGIALFDVASRSRIARLERADHAALTPDGRTLAAGGVGNVIALYSLESRKLTGTLRWAPERQTMANFGVQISPDGRWLVEKSQAVRWLGERKPKPDYQEQVLVVWDLPKRRKLAELRAGPPNAYLIALDNDSDVAFSPDSRILAYARNDAATRNDPVEDKVALWDLGNQTERAFDAPGATSLAFDPTGTILAVGFEDRVELRDTGSFAVLQTMRGPQGTTSSALSFSTDGRRLATTGTKGARLWEVGDLAGVPVLAGTLVDRDDDLSFQTDVAFSPDGRLLAVADGGPEVILWDLDERSWRETLCSLVDRDFNDAERHQFFPGGQAGPTCGS